MLTRKPSAAVGATPPFPSSDSPQDRREPQAVPPVRFRVRAFPTLLPEAVVAPWGRELPFPFNRESASYYFFARNAIYWLARAWKLEGEEILFPAYFHGVELEALLAAGVRPRFYPVREGMRVEAAEVLARVTPRTRAVYLIHYLGFPGPVEELAEACRARGLRLIEDCALALLSRREGRALGSWGDAAVFCLYKTLPVPNGGALVTREAALPQAEASAPPLGPTLAGLASSVYLGCELRRRRWASALLKGARRLGRAVRRNGDAEPVYTGTQHFSLEHARLGMSRVSRVIVAAQDYEGIVARRRRNFSYLLERLRGVARPVFDALPEGVCPLFFPVEVADKKAVVERLHARGVEAVDFWSLSHAAVPAGAFPEAERLRATVVELPCHQDVEPAELDWMAERVEEAPGV